MPTHDFSDVGDVLNYEVVQGTIKTIDSAADTCVVTVNGKDLSALFFYHCEHDSPERSNGAIQGAASGFSINDTVCVLKKIKANPSINEVKIIGHTDGVKRCSGNYIEIVVAAQKHSDYSWYPIKYVFVWDVKNAVLLYDGALSTDAGYVAWKAKRTIDCDAESTMNPVYWTGNTANWPPDPGHYDDCDPPESFTPPEGGPGDDIQQTKFYGSVDFYAFGPDSVFCPFLNGYSWYSDPHPYTGYSYFRSHVIATLPTCTVTWHWWGNSWYESQREGTAIINHSFFTPFGLIFAYSSSYTWYPPDRIDWGYSYDHLKLGYTVQKNNGLSCKNFMVNIFTLYGNVIHHYSVNESDTIDNFVVGDCQVQIVYDEAVEDILTVPWLTFPINLPLGAKITTAMRKCLTDNMLSPASIGAFTMYVTPQILK
jgi:hypothetical protein